MAGPSHAGPGTACNTPEFIDQTFADGARWQFCFEERAEEGVVIVDAYWNPPGETAEKVLAEAALAQIYVTHDDGGSAHQVTQVGLGGAQLRDLSSDECPGGTLVASGGKNLLCKVIDSPGYLYKHRNTHAPAHVMTLFSVSRIGSIDYIVQWRFYAGGMIEPAVRIGGQLERFGTNALYGWPLDGVGTVGVAQVHTYYWKLDFDIHENGNNDVVEELWFTPQSSDQQRVMNLSVLTTESARDHDPETFRSWRVRDGSATNDDGNGSACPPLGLCHAVSYHLEPLEFKYNPDEGAGAPWTQSMFYATADDACERFATENPTTGGCGAHVADYVDGENLDQADVVVWYAVSAYRLPRAEDQPYVNSHWDGFRIVPRDWTDTSKF